ncbi:hypothetical protein [Kitasatospora aureofaciens]|uniref:hypothetical protein n=1 Tax=Kitasatospora aureofaciens TaxID=1894 RepID=UPI00052612CE|nr:hypothetical protein [Kitasatospora aureofaciens]
MEAPGHKHIVQFSGGIGSFAAALRVVERYGPENTTLLIADTLIEDPDLWRFSRAASQALGAPLVRVADGRTPFRVFHDIQFLGNSWKAPCSLHLKIRPCLDWLTQNADPENTTLYIGIDSSVKDRARIPPIARNWQPWRTEFILCAEGEPELTKDELLEEARNFGVEPPRLYALDYPHNNCGGLCVRAGKAQWLHTLRTFPERYAIAEAEEEAFRAKHGDYSILKEQRNKVVYRLTLRELRLREENSRSQSE